MRAPLRLALSVLASIAGVSAATAAADVTRVDVVDSRFRVTTSDGGVLHSDRLAGAVLTIGVNGRAVRVRIDAVERDTMRTDTTDVWLHAMSFQRPDGSWADVCLPDPNGRRLAFPIAGRAGPDGILQPAEDGRLEVVCTSGAQGKCARFGYRPWAIGPDGKSLLPAYNACVRMLRGDYGGRNEPLTRNGMWVDVFDTIDLQKTDHDPALVFEAGWGPDGAVCVHHPRVPENVTLEQLEARYPRLRGRTGAICTEEFARAHGALIFNRSRPPGG